MKRFYRFPLICWTIALATFLALNSPALAQVASVSATSPNGKLVITIQTVGRNGTRPSGGGLVYSVSFENKPLIQRSRLGLDLSGQDPLGPAIRIEHVEQGKVDQTYHLLAGKASVVRDVCNTVHLDLLEIFGSHRKLAIEARAYDDAVAFRYLVPEQPDMKDFRLARENT
ncbi:MAG TPA: glycoside hydrolase family 97 N-terminal domain-containing protein, partial [Tepidisphaeraceae bacterium]|nr:glycoside hydrolase family 97 N-terminal domain-containing protein [Tepidisphaeraceae bacterium]